MFIIMFIIIIFIIKLIIMFLYVRHILIQPRTYTDSQ